MKTLHDGTEVEDNVPTRNTGKGRFLLTAEEISKRQSEESANILERERYDREEKYKADRISGTKEKPIKYDNGDALDALMKDANLRRLGGEDLCEDLDAAVNHWLAVKTAHPKPKAES